MDSFNRVGDFLNRGFGFVVVPIKAQILTAGTRTVKKTRKAKTVKRKTAKRKTAKKKRR